MARLILMMSLLVVTAACSSADPPDVGFGEPQEPPRTPTEAASAGPVAWRHLATTDGLLKGSAAAAAIESPGDLATAWDQYGFADSAPAVAFERSFVLLLGQPDDACIDELIGLEVRDGALQARWLPPPGGCATPLIFRIHAIEVDRRHVPPRFDVAFPRPFEQDAEPVTIEVAARDGAAPPAPQPPTAMADDDLAAVFEGHPVRRCGDESPWRDERRVDGPLSDDPKVAEAQRRRADFGVASDEESTRAAMADPADGEPMDFPITDAELQADADASGLLDNVRAWLRREGLRDDVDFVPFISRTGGIRPGVLVDNGKAGDVRRMLDAEFGKDTVVVVDHPYDFAEIDAAQAAVGQLMGGEGPGSIVMSTGLPGPVELGMIDPTRKALDRVAATVDPALVCVSPELSGVSAEVGRP